MFKLFAIAMGLACEMLRQSEDDFSSDSIFQMSCEVALSDTELERNDYPVGEVDTTKVAFSLDDDHNVSMIVGDKEFANDLDKIVWGMDDDNED